MEDKAKISLLYMLIGGLLGAASAFLTVLGVPNSVILALYVLVVYATTYLYPFVGVSLEKLGEKRYRSALGGVFPSILPWLVIWTMVFYLICPVVILAGAPHEQAAADLREYLESNGISVKISDDYSRYLSAHKVIVLGSRVSLPLGTSFGVSIFPDTVQGLLALEKDKGNTQIEKVNTGEFIIIRKNVRVIIIISGHGDADTVAQITKEKQEAVYNLL